VISHSCIHNDKKVYFFHELGEQDKENQTWANSPVNLNGQSYISGPIKFRFSDSIAYVSRPNREQNDTKKISGANLLAQTMDGKEQ
jgi:hypothetical protein